MILPEHNTWHMIIDANLTQQAGIEDNDSRYYFESNKYYTQTHLLISFFVVNGLLIPTGVIGLSKVMKKEDKSLLLTIVLLICFSLSISWILFAENTTLVADRWIIMFGIFFSIFAAYGIVRSIIRSKKISANKRIIISSSILGLFIIIGMIYATRPAEHSFNLISATDTNPFIRSVTLGTMQPDKESIDKLMNAISWINENTEQNSTIIGEKRWRGMMQLELDNGRKWQDFGLNKYTTEKFSVVFNSFISDHNNIYLLAQGTNLFNDTGTNLQVVKIYSHKDFAIFKIASQ